MPDFSTAIDAQRAFFLSQETKPHAFRVVQLRSMLSWITAHEREILQALGSDLGKHPCEGYMTEYYLVRHELRYALRHLKAWMRPRRPLPSLGQLPGRCRVTPQPYGVALVMSPWNYPFQLTMLPLIGAIAAGNCITLKPSAYAPATSALLGDMAQALFPPAYIQVIQGGREEIAALLDEAFDSIFFTGSPAVGRLVMEKASRHLTPVTLELGGKSPALVDETADISLAAKRIAWGKFLNCGQTCVAPDYVLVHQSREQELLDQIIAAIRQLYGSAPLAGEDLGRIVNRRHFDRLVSMLGDGSISHGGQIDSAALRISPTVLTDVPWDAPLMREEIFGPLLPIMTYRKLDEAVARIRSLPKPLALYLFSQNKETRRRVLSEVPFGGGCVNDTVMHMASSRMPFGGVGHSGMGAYHGKASFLAFSQAQSLLERGRWPDVPIRYAPYGNKLPWVRKVL
ncbi:MAG: aldehyde dehydrogenase [Candidatus Limiplasma sp.]|nr:aldehyde dehydrogenase [Candidatus Limiplasma sp.]